MTQARTSLVLPALASLALVALAGCDLPANPPRARLWTLFDFERLADAAGDGHPSLAADAGLPGGIPLDHFVARVSAATQLTLGTTFTFGYRSAYVTPELWSRYDEVWVQPAYVPVTAFEDENGNPTPVKLTDADGKWHPIFSVGAGSLFYSPFWQMVYFKVDPGTPVDKYTSARQIVDGGFPLRPAEGRIMSIAPSAITGPDTSALPAGRTISPLPRKQGWLDGQPAYFVDLGSGTFRWNAARVVEEVPLFVFVTRSADGALAALDVPSVSGAAPVGTRVDSTMLALGGKPRYGALWRLYTVQVPPTARAYTGVPAAPDAMLGSLVTGRVALDPTCFDNPVNLAPVVEGSQCVWLDDQNVIQARVDAPLIKRTELLITCPFVSYQDMAVPL